MISGLRSHGLRVPADVSVVGMDDVLDGELMPIRRSRPSECLPASSAAAAWHLLMRTMQRDGCEPRWRRASRLRPRGPRLDRAASERRLVPTSASSLDEAARGGSKGTVTTGCPASAQKSSSPTIASTSCTRRSRWARTSGVIYDTAEGVRLWDTEGKDVPRRLVPDGELQPRPRAPRDHRGGADGSSTSFSTWASTTGTRARPWSSAP